MIAEISYSPLNEASVVLTAEASISNDALEVLDAELEEELEEANPGPAVDVAVVVVEVVVAAASIPPVTLPSSTVEAEISI